MYSHKPIKDQINRSYFRFSIKPLILATLLTSAGYAEFIPADEPVARLKSPKPNIIFILDNSKSMGLKSDAESETKNETKYLDGFMADIKPKDNSFAIGSRYEYEEDKNKILPYGVSQALIERFIRSNVGRIKLGLSHLNYINPHVLSNHFWYSNGAYEPFGHPEITKKNQPELTFEMANKAMSDNPTVGGYSGLRFPIEELGYRKADGTVRNAATDVLNKLYQLKPVDVATKQIAPFNTYASTYYDMTKIMMGEGIWNKIELVNAKFPGNPLPGQIDINQNGSMFEQWSKPKQWNYYPNPRKFRCETNHIALITTGHNHSYDGAYGVIREQDEDRLLRPGDMMYDPSKNYLHRSYLSDKYNPTGRNSTGPTDYVIPFWYYPNYAAFRYPVCYRNNSSGWTKYVSCFTPLYQIDHTNAVLLENGNLEHLENPLMRVSLPMIFNRDRLGANIADGYNIGTRYYQLEDMLHLTSNLYASTGREGTVGERKGLNGDPNVDMGGMAWNAGWMKTRIDRHGNEETVPADSTDRYPSENIRRHALKIGDYFQDVFFSGNDPITQTMFSAPDLSIFAGSIYPLSSSHNLTYANKFWSKGAMTPSQLDTDFSKIVENFNIPNTMILHPQLVTQNGQSITLNTTFYDTSYDPYIWTGNVKAIGLHQYNAASYTFFKDLWNTNETLEVRCAENTTITNLMCGNAGVNNSTDPLLNNIRVANAGLNGLSGGSPYTELQQLYNGSNDANYQAPNFYYGRYVEDEITRQTPLGSIINSTITTLLPDSLYNNTSAMSDINTKKLNDYLVERSKVADNSYFVGGSSDGLLSFISLNSTLKAEPEENKRAGKRDVALMPNYWYKRYKQGAEELAAGVHKFRLDGAIEFMDGIIKKGGVETPITVGIAMYGSGGNGYIGFKVNNFDTSLPAKSAKGIEPLYEMEPDVSSTLGYTYSGVEFANIHDSTTGEPKIIALFGNGYGKSQSSLWIIDAVTGNKLKEISLGNTGGASTPALIVKKDAATGFQSLDRAYIGDLQGNLYLITFGSSYSSYTTKKIFTTDGNRPITVQPTVLVGDNASIHWLYFGTGMLAQESDRYDDKKESVQDYFYGLRFNTNTNSIGGGGYNDHTLSVDKNQYMSSFVVNITGAAGSQTTNGSLDDKYKGWRITLEPGEQVLQSSASYYNKFIIINTYALELGDTAGFDQCNLDSVFSKNLIVYKDTGNSAGSAVFGGKESQGGISYKGQGSMPVGAGITQGNANSGQGSNHKPSMEAINKLEGSQWDPENNPPCSTASWGNLAIRDGDGVMGFMQGYCLEESKSGRIYFERKY